MRVLVSGSSGFVGTALCDSLKAGGHEVGRIVRRESTAAGEVEWDQEKRKLDLEAMEGFDAFVHLAGENLASGRWTKERMRKIRDSRVEGTRAICRAAARLKKKPEVIVSASAIGWYGDRGDETLDEESKPGTGFLVEVCRDWEASCYAAREAKLRVVNARIGVVLAPHGGALKKMLLPFKLGAGGRLGSGRQYMSWISLRDVVRGLVFCIENKQLEGPVNLVGPNAVTNAEYTKTLGRVLSRPTIFPVPAFVAGLVFGKMADEALLASTRVVPKTLADAGFEFQDPNLEEALRGMLS